MSTDHEIVKGNLSQVNRRSSGNFDVGPKWLSREFNSDKGKLVIKNFVTNFVSQTSITIK